MADLLSVEVALDRILNHLRPLPSESVDIHAALGRVLADTVVSEIDLPSFANSSMDGYAVRAADTTSAAAANPTRLRVVMDIPAGAAPTQTIHPGEAARIMTGAPMPPGADAIIPVEDTDTHWQAGSDIALAEQVAISRAVRAGDYVRPAGENVRQGQTVLEAGTLLRPQDLGILAALGCAEISAIRQPRVAIVSTGDELVEVNEPLAPGKIRDVNGYTIAGLVTQYGGIALRQPVARDMVEVVRQLFESALEQQPDLVISTAGVSVGTFDVVRAVLAELGAVDFWRVSVRPGKPLAYGNLRGVPFFGLPGNPVSAMVTFDIFVRPALFKLMGRSDEAETVTAVTAEDLESDNRRTYLRVQLRREQGRLIAQTTGTQSSGALMSMMLADGLLIVPENRGTIQAGTELPVRLLRSL